MWHDVETTQDLLNFKPIPFFLLGRIAHKAFNNQIDTICNYLISCTRNMKELPSVRGTLLPKLLSGEIQIPEAEKLEEGDV